MKTTLKNQYTIANQILLAVVSSTFGYNLYQAIAHPEKSHLILSILLLAFTYFMVEKYGTKIEQEKEKI
jgi:positive regulator of sigma E activity